MRVEAGEADFYDSGSNFVPGARAAVRGYWRDVGTLNAYYEAHMDLLPDEPAFDLHDPEWPIFTWNEPAPPAKFLSPPGGPKASVENSLVSAGVVGKGGTVVDSVMSPGVVVHPNGRAEGSVLLNGV